VTSTCSSGACVVVNAASGTPCDDGDPCTFGETCDENGSCKTGTPHPCEPIVDCYRYECDGQGGCVNTWVFADGEPCIEKVGQCNIKGYCYSMTYHCKTFGGVWLPGPCEDGDPCTMNDTCDATGTCKGAPDPVCAPDAGTDGGSTICQPNARICWSTTQTAVCHADGSAWTITDCAQDTVCVGGKCEPAAPDGGTTDAALEDTSSPDGGTEDTG
jgi:hypothetical protein